MKIKRVLYLTHRWFGIAMSIMFLLWFASGIVMMYVEYPEFTIAEKLASKPTLDLSSVQVDIDSIPMAENISELTLTSLLNRPVYQLAFTDQFGRHREQQIFADLGNGFIATDAKTALAIATNYAKQIEVEATPSYVGTIDMDQWTVYGGLDSHRPLHKVALNNHAGTVLYISHSTGEIVRDTHRWERRWNWVGSTIHWIYPMQLRRHSSLWVDVVVWVSMAGILSVVTGTIIGFLRLRIKRRYKNGRVTPYSGWQKWHHLLGLSCALIVGMFVVSGLFSMSPFGLFENKTSAFPQVQRYQGGIYNLDGFQESLERLSNNPSENIPYKELSWHMLGGKGVLVGYSENQRSVINFDSTALAQQIKNVLPRLLPDQQLVELEKLESYDSYYYSTHNRYRPLPAYRAKFDDEERTWYYIDALTGELLNRSTYTDRVHRWLYNGLHSLDFQFLLQNRPLWDLLVILLSILGILFSYTSLVIAWRRLQKTKPFNRKKPITQQQGVTNDATI